MAISDLPFLHALGDGGPRSSTQVVVIHATDNTAAASSEAAYATRRPDRTSAHFYVDDDAAYRALPLDNIAFGCLPHGNRISVQFELVGRSNAISDATMRRAAPLVAELCKAYGIPPAAVSSSAVRGGAKGICGHDTITLAFPEDGGDHTDPGSNFPWGTFIGYVKAALDPTEEDDDMFAWKIDLPSGPGSEVSESIPWVNQGSGGYGPAWLNLTPDNYGVPVAFRLAVGDGTGKFVVDERVVIKSGQTYSKELPAGSRVVSLRRLSASEGDLCQRLFGAVIEYSKRA